MKIVSDYIPLPQILMKNTYTYVLYRRGIKALIYEQRVSKKIIAYEVFKKIISPEKNIKGKILPPREKFPSNEDFGFTAWSCKTKQRASEKFHELEGPLVTDNKQLELSLYNQKGG